MAYYYCIHVLHCTIIYGIMHKDGTIREYEYVEYFSGIYTKIARHHIEA